MNNPKDIKAIIVCCASSIDKIKNILLFTPKEVKISKSEYIVMMPFKSKSIANIHLANDFLKPDILNEEEIKLISNGRKNEFNKNGVNISIRIKNEMDYFIGYYQDLTVI